MPTSQNVDIILKDYAPLGPVSEGKHHKKSKEVIPPGADKPKYATAHIHFVDG